MLTCRKSKIMPKHQVFDENYGRYESWFQRNEYAYKSELEAVKSLLPTQGRGIEIGIGTGLFTEPLSIREGIEKNLHN